MNKKEKERERKGRNKEIKEKGKRRNITLGIKMIFWSLDRVTQ